MRSTYFSFLTTSLLLALPTTLFAQQSDRIFAPGFREVSSAPGVTLFQKGKDYVHIVSPRRDGGVRLLYGAVSEGTEDTQFARKDIREWWQTWSQAEPQAFSLMNSQFFNASDPTKAALAFSTKADGVVYEGYGDKREFLGGKMLLRIGAKHTIVQPYNDNPRSLDRFPEPDIIVGLRADIDKQSARRLGRTFIAGMPQGNLLIFTSPKATQQYAERILVSFGADWDNVLMLDGGGSTQLVHKGKVLVPSHKPGKDVVHRPLPQALGIVAGKKH
jgi:hypothetical protein